VDVAQDAIITEYDCGTMDGLIIGALVEGGEIIEALGERILGRVALDDIHDPVTGEVLVRANEEIDEGKVGKIENSGLDKVKIRSVLTCQARRGICVECYGRDLARGRKVSIGEAVGVIAAQSIGEPGTQLTMRTFHIGGAATRRAEQSSLENRNAGTVKFSNLNTVKRADGTLVVMNRNGEVLLVDDSGRERERYQVIYGAKLLVKDAQKLEGPTLLASGTRSRFRSSPRSAVSSVRRHHRGRHHVRDARRGHRSVPEDHHRVQGPRRPSADHHPRRRRRGADPAQLRAAGQLLPVAGLDHHGERR
jgi:DNA-directed RNA polymerase subunit beta'